VITELPEAEFRSTRARAHGDCVVCGPANSRGLHLVFERSPDGGVHASFDCDKSFEGYAGMVHGGLVASVLDGAMTNCLFARGICGVTAELTIRFRRPLTTGRVAAVHAWIDRSSTRLYLLKAEIVQDGAAIATASGKFMEHTPAPGSVSSGSTGWPTAARA
jgi:uncharacterized protein (TIGR00369 family)